MLSFLRSPGLLVFSGLVLVQGALGYYLNARSEYVPRNGPLTRLPKTVGVASMVREHTTEAEVQEVLKADDTLSRTYVAPSLRNGAHVWIAYFKSQRAGVAPHSPKNCLPGNGWVKERNSILRIDIPGRAEPIEAQYYLVQRGENKSVVIYWYQSHGRVVADEYHAKFFVVADAIRHNRTDTALVKFTVPVGPEGTERTTEAAINMVKDFFGPVSAVLPE